LRGCYSTPHFLLLNATDLCFAPIKSVSQPIECNAMVAFAPNEPLRLETVLVAAPKAGEVRVRVIANALCHTDV